MDSRVKYLRSFILPSIRKMFFINFVSVFSSPLALVLMNYRISSSFVFSTRKVATKKIRLTSTSEKEAIIKFEDKNKFDISQKCRVKFSMKLVGRINWSLELCYKSSCKRNIGEKKKKEFLPLLTDDNQKQFWDEEKVLYDCFLLFTAEIFE